MKVGRPEKVTWAKVYKDFRQNHPNLRPWTCGFRPHNYAEILVYGLGKYHYIYNFDTKMVKKIDKKDVIL